MPVRRKRAWNPTGEQPLYTSDRDFDSKAVPRVDAAWFSGHKSKWKTVTLGGARSAVAREDGLRLVKYGVKTATGGTRTMYAYNTGQAKKGKKNPTTHFTLERWGDGWAIKSRLTDSTEPYVRILRWKVTWADGYLTAGTVWDQGSGVYVDSKGVAFNAEEKPSIKVETEEVKLPTRYRSKETRWRDGWEFYSNTKGWTPVLYPVKKGKANPKRTSKGPQLPEVSLRHSFSVGPLDVTMPNPASDSYPDLMDAPFYLVYPDGRVKKRAYQVRSQAEKAAAKLGPEVMVVQATLADIRQRWGPKARVVNPSAPRRPYALVGPFSTKGKAIHAWDRGGGGRNTHRQTLKVKMPWNSGTGNWWSFDHEAFESEADARKRLKDYLKSQKELMKDVKPPTGMRSSHGVVHKPRRSNPEASAAALYEKFHGQPPDKVVTVTEKVKGHGYLTGLGDLVSFRIKTPSGWRGKIDFDSRQPVLLTSNEKGDQLYFVGGDQRMPLRSMNMGAKKWVRDSMVLGELTQITYRTRKKMHKFGLIDYFHKAGEETGVRPTLIYDCLNHTLEISGGQYEVRPEGIVN